MKTHANRPSSLIHAPQPQPLAADAPPAQANMQAHRPPAAADAPPGHATVHNLHQDARFAKLFQRVDVNQRNIEDFFRDRQARANERLNLAPAAPEGLLREDAPAQAPANAGPAPQDFGNYAHMFTFTKEDRGLVAQLKVSDKPGEGDFTDQAYTAMRQDMQMAADVQDAGKSAFSRYLGKFKNLFKSGEEVRFEKTVGEDALRMKIRSKSSRGEGEGHHIDTSYKKEVKDKTFWTKVGFGVLAAAGVVAAAVLLGPIVVPALVTAVTGLSTAALITGAIGGAVATPILLKSLSLIKSPWWGKTVEGQIQHEERRQAKALADSYATQVRAQVRGEQLNDAGEPAVRPDDGGPSLPKRLLIDNPAKLSDFLKLAHDNDRDALLAKVREELLSDRSHLDINTIKHAKQSSFVGWGFTGNQKGHANKTVDIVAEEITRGIMRGVAEGMMDLAIARCADEMTEAAKDPLWTTVKPRLDAFTQAIDRTSPDKDIHGHDVEWGIHETAPPLARLQQYKANADTLTAQVKQTLQDNQDKWGENNVQAYAQGLDQLNADIDTHIQSLQEIQHLVGDVQEAGRQPAPVAVRHINEALGQLLIGEFADAQALDAADAKTRQDLASLRAQVQGQSKARLLETHAQAFEGLIGRLDQARGALLGRAKVLTEARQLFKNGPMDRQALQAQLQALKTLENRISLDINPADSQTLAAQFVPAEQALVALRTQAEQLDKAYGLQDELKRLQDESVQLAADGDFGSALNRRRLHDLERNLRLQDDALEQWGDNARPADLQAAQGLNGWRAAVVTAGLKLSQEQARPLETVLTRLCEPDNAPLLQQLAALPTEPCVKALTILSQALQNAAAAGPAQALTAYQALSDMDLGEEPVELDLRKLTLSVFPGALNELNTLQALHRTADLLARLENTDVGRQLRQSDPQQTDDLLSLLGDALSRAPDSDATVADAVQELLRASGGRPLSALAGDPQALLTLAVSRQQFEQLIALLDVLMAPPPAKPLAQKGSVARAQAQALADKLHNQVRPQALINVMAGVLAEAPAEGSDDVRVQQNVRKGAALKNEADRSQALALNQDLVELKELQQLRQDQQEDNLRALKNNAEKLNAVLGLSDKLTPEQLIEKIGQNRELAHEINLLMGALETLEGQEAPAGLRKAYTSQELLTGALALSQLPAWPKTQIEQVKIGNSAQARRMQDRNALIEEFRDKDKQQLQRKLASPKAAQQVEVFLDEERALTALHQVNKSSLTMAQFRAQVGQAPAGAAGVAQHIAAQRQQMLDISPMRVVHQQLRDGLQPRLAAVQELIGASESQFITSQSNYLVAQIPAHYEQIDSAESIQKAFGTPASAQLAALGQKLREADTLRELTGNDAGNLARIKMHFLKGQHEASLQALKYLNLDKFEAKRPGLFGRMLYKIFNRGERLQRLMRADTRQQAAELMGLTAKQLTGNAMLQQQLHLVQATIQNTQKRHDALFEKSENVAMAYALLVTERLAAKSSDGLATFESADAEEVDKQWLALMGGSATLHSHALTNLRKNHLGKNTQAIEAGLNDEQFNAVAKEVSHLLTKRAEISEIHRQFRQDIANGKLAQLAGPRQANTLQVSALRAGLDAEDLSTIQQLATANIVHARRLDQWALAMELATKKPGQALVEATYARERVRLGLRAEERRVAALKNSVAQLMDQVSSAREDDPTLNKKLQDTTEEFLKASAGLEQLKDSTHKILVKLENRFLLQLGEQAPTRLAEPDAIHPKLAEHLESLRQMETKVSDGQSVSPEALKQAWEQLKPVLPEFSTDLLDADKAPESLADIALAAELNFRLGAVAYESMAKLPPPVQASDEIHQTHLNNLQDLVTSILKEAEKSARALDDGVGKWHCPPGEGRRFAYGNHDQADRMKHINRMLDSKDEDRFHQMIADEDDEVSAMDVAVDNT